MDKLDYLITPNAKSSAQDSARKVLDNLFSADPRFLHAIQNGDMRVNYVDDQGRVMNLDLSGTSVEINVQERR